MSCLSLSYIKDQHGYSKTVCEHISEQTQTANKTNDNDCICPYLELDSINNHESLGDDFKRCDYESFSKFT